MTEKSYKNNFNSEAMYCGTMLGIFWILTSAIYIFGLSIPFLSSLFLMLLIASPFYAGFLAIKFRKHECNNSITFVKAWIFLLIMHLCASLLLAITQYIYLIYFDHGYLFGFVQEQINLVLELPDIDDATKELMEQTSELWSKITVKEIVIQLFYSNIMITGIITPIIAFFVKRK